MPLSRTANREYVRLSDRPMRAVGCHLKFAKFSGAPPCKCAEKHLQGVWEADSDRGRQLGMVLSRYMSQTLPKDEGERH